MLLWKKGPSTVGVFRTTCNNKTLKAIREQLNSGTAVEMDALPVVLLVGLLKVKSHPSVHSSVPSVRPSVRWTLSRLISSLPLCSNLQRLPF